MEGIEEEFQLTTSREFCGANRSRASEDDGLLGAEARLLQQVPLPLRRRYLARLRCELQGAPRAEPRWRFRLFAAVALLASLAGKTMVPLGEIEVTWEQNGTERVELSCPVALQQAEDEAIAMEVLTRRDIMGYNQMLASIHDWTTTLKARVPAPIGRCLKVEGPRYLNLVQELRSSLLAAHARAARSRARVSMDRNAHLGDFLTFN